MIFDFFDSSEFIQMSKNFFIYLDLSKLAFYYSHYKFKVPYKINPLKPMINSDRTNRKPIDNYNVSFLSDRSVNYENEKKNPYK